MKLEEWSYEGKRVFVGIDVHRDKYAICCICGDVVVKRWTLSAPCPTTLLDQLRHYFEGGEIHSAYEAGFSGFELHRVLLAGGISNRVVHAAGIEVKSNNRVKTDKRDARKLAEQLASGRLRGVAVPTESDERRRALTRGREQVVNRRRSIGNQLKMKLYYLGIALPRGWSVSERFLRWVEQLELAPEHRFSVDELVKAWRDETDRLKRYEERLKKSTAKDRLLDIYRSVPGVGEISAHVLRNELGDLKRFDNERQLFCLSGLTPSEYSSGDRVRRGHISRQGSSRIRAILVEVAWRAVRCDGHLQKHYERIKTTRGGKRAIVAVARRMLGQIRACMTINTEWRDLSARFDQAA